MASSPRIEERLGQDRNGFLQDEKAQNAIAFVSNDVSVCCHAFGVHEDPIVVVESLFAALVGAQPSERESTREVFAR